MENIIKIVVFVNIKKFCIFVIKIDVCVIICLIKKKFVLCYSDFLKLIYFIIFEFWSIVDFRWKSGYSFVFIVFVIDKIFIMVFRWIVFCIFIVVLF